MKMMMMFIPGGGIFFFLELELQICEIFLFYIMDDLRDFTHFILLIYLRVMDDLRDFTHLLILLIYLRVSK